MFETDEYANLFEQISVMRVYRAEFLASVHGGGVSLEGIFERGASDPVLGSMKVLPAVESLPDSGKVQTRRAFEEVGIAEDGHICDVSRTQLDKLPEALERHAR